MAFTAVGSAVTRVCPWFERMDDGHAAMILLHEALHRAGLDEWPHDPDGLTPQGITDMVTEHYGLGAARRAASALVVNLEDLASKNGTSRRGRPVMSVVELSERDVITIGATVLVVRVADADAPTETATGRAHN